MAPTPITPTVSPKKSHKKIKVLRRPKGKVCSIGSNNDDLTNNQPTESKYAVAIRPSPITPSKPYLRHAKLTHRTNRIANAKQYVIGDDVILPSWSRQSLFISPNITKSVGPKSLKRYASNAFANDKAPPYIKKKHKSMQVLASVHDPHSIPSHGTIENHHLRRYLLEEIMSASPGERLLILVSSSHPYWGEYSKVINRCPPLPQVIQGLLSFW